MVITLFPPSEAIRARQPSEAPVVTLLLSKLCYKLESGEQYTLLCYLHPQYYRLVTIHKGTIYLGTDTD